MTYSDMKKFAMFLTGSGTNGRSHGARDIYYNPVTKTFLHRTAKSRCSSAVEWNKGKERQGYISKKTIHVGRYDVDVNPEWIIEDMQSV